MNAQDGARPHWPAALATAESMHALLGQVAAAGHAVLRGPDGAEARAYLMETRGLSADVLRRARIGYVPAGPSSMRDLVQQVGGNLEVARAAGLVRLRDRPVLAAATAAGIPLDRPDEVATWLADAGPRNLTWYGDYYQQSFEGPSGGEGLPRTGHWIMMPLWTRDSAGAPAVYGVQLRSCYASEQIGKGGRYRNPPVTSLMPRAAPLAGLVEEHARLSAFPDRAVVLCEGGYDRLALIDALTTWFGTADRPAVIALGSTDAIWTPDPDGGPCLAELTPRPVVLWTDSDGPGREARLGLIAALAARGHDVRVARQEAFHGAKDPNECWVGAPEALRAAWEDAQGLSGLDWALGQAPSPEGPHTLFAQARQLDVVIEASGGTLALRRAQQLGRRLGAPLEAMLGWAIATNPPAVRLSGRAATNRP